MQDDDVGADECCLCGKDWREGDTGWPLCDTEGCDSTLCTDCLRLTGASVGDLFFCPPCAGSGVSAAADETLRFWKILSGGEASKKERAAAKDSILNTMSIR